MPRPRYVTERASREKDTSCEAVTECADDEYEFKKAKWDKDTVCELLTECDPSESYVNNTRAPRRTARLLHQFTRAHVHVGSGGHGRETPQRR